MSTQDTFLAIFNAIDFEKIKDHPNILIAANFWDEDRFRAAKTCYGLMRAVDDLVDDYKSEHPVIDDVQKEKLITEVNEWISMVLADAKNNIEHQDIIETFEVYRIPLASMKAFAKSMIYDILNDGFPTMQSYLDYARGASVAPASIFIHLCGLTKKDGNYVKPAFDVKKTATPCAIFSYLVHIIRDFQKDQLNNLNYFADDLIAKYGLDRQKLSSMAHGTPIEDGFRQLIREYYNLADEYRLKTYDTIAAVKPYLEPRYKLSLDIIFNLYLMVFERIDPDHGTFTASELTPTADEIRQRVYETIKAFKDTPSSF